MKNVKEMTEQELRTEHDTTIFEIGLAEVQKAYALGRVGSLIDELVVRGVFNVDEKKEETKTNE